MLGTSGWGRLCKNEQDTVFVKFTVRALMLTSFPSFIPHKIEIMQVICFLLYSNFPERLSGAGSGAGLPWVSVWWQERSLSYLRNPKKPLVPSSMRPSGGGGSFCCNGGVIFPARLSPHLESARKTLRQGKGVSPQATFMWAGEGRTPSMSPGQPQTRIIRSQVNCLFWHPNFISAQ